MLDSIKTFFNNNFMINEKGHDNSHALKLATAALLIEMMQQDHEVKDEEKQAVKIALKKKFELSDAETNELYMLAKQEVKEATDYHQFTTLIAQHYTQQQKIKIVEYLWSIAFADNHIDKYEEHMVRRIADLIHVSHKDFIKCKHRVVESNR
ncbi:MAG: TerB family tellurite resistance protein [Gammaproteobacteria bacterium]|nr:TerB family tellurite resistance protein [Gammaproteobacteria bacterium]